MAKAEPGTKDQRGWGYTHLTPSEKEGKREKRANSIHKLRPPPSAAYQLRARASRVERLVVRDVPGVQSFDNMESPETATIMAERRKCGYRRLRVVKSTISAAGYGLYLDQRILKAGGLITSYEGISLTKQQVEAFLSDYIFQMETRMGTK